MLLEVAKNSFSYPLTLLLVVLTRTHARGRGGGFRAQSSTKSKHILHQQQDIIVYH